MGRSKMYERLYDMTPSEMSEIFFFKRYNKYLILISLHSFDSQIKGIILGLTYLTRLISK